MAVSRPHGRMAAEVRALGRGRPPSPRRPGRRLVGHPPRGRLQVLPHAAHMTPFTDPAALAYRIPQRVLR